MRHLRTYHIALFCLALSAFFISAQAQAQAQEKADKSCRIVLIDDPRKLYKDFFLYDGFTSQPVKFSRMNISPTYRLNANCKKVWILKQAIEKPEQLPEDMPSIAIPEKMLDVLVVGVEDKKAKNIPIKLASFDIGFERFTNGEMLWMNFSKHAVGGILLTGKFNLNPGTSTVVKQPDDGKTNFTMHLYNKAPDKERYFPLFKGNLVTNKRARRIMFIYDDGVRSTPRWKGYSDFREQKDRLPRKVENEEQT